jgi:hypothetical protein
LASAVSNSSVIRLIAGRMRSMFFTLNVLASMRRSTSCSGASRAKKSPGRAIRPGTTAGKPGLAGSELSRESISSALMSSYRVTSQATRSPEIATRCAGPASLHWPSSAGGSSGWSPRSKGSGGGDRTSILITVSGRLSGLLDRRRAAGVTPPPGVGSGGGCGDHAGTHQAP